MSWSPSVAFAGSVLLLIGSLACNIKDPLAGGETGVDNDTGTSSPEEDSGPSPSNDASDQTDGTPTPPDTGPDATSDIDPDTDQPDADGSSCLETDPCNGRDDDCDGEIDEGCTCTPGETRDCYSGPSGTMGVGLCTGGTTTCNPDATWGSCEGETTPQPEQCDDGLDNDCDGAADLNDADCIKDVGESCAKDAECPGPCVASGSGGDVCAHRLFVSSTTFKGGFGGIPVGDQRCNSMASDANLSGNWKVVLSTRSTDARQHIGIRAPIVNTNGTRLASDESDLWDGTIANPVLFDESGRRTETTVWTGTQGNGAAAPSGQFCGNNWNSNAPVKRGKTGESNSASSWIDGSSVADCKSSLSIYCIDGQ